MNKLIKRVVAGLSTMALAASMLTISALAVTPTQRMTSNYGSQTDIKTQENISALLASQDAANIYKDLNGGTIKNAIVATSKDYPDTLSAGYVSSSRSAPILYDGNNRTLDYIKKNVSKGGYIYLIGGTSVISSTFETQVRSAGYTPIRLGGKNRYETNLWCLKNTGGNYADNMLICSALNYPDALAAAATKRPVMIVNPNGMTTEQINYIKSGTTKRFTIIGGTVAVSAKVESQLKSNFGSSSVDRLGGANRYKTCDLVMKKYCNNASTWVIADGYSYQGALIGAAIASKSNGALLLSGKGVFSGGTYNNMATPKMRYLINLNCKENAISSARDYKKLHSYGVEAVFESVSQKYESGIVLKNSTLKMLSDNNSLENTAKGYYNIVKAQFPTIIGSTFTESAIYNALKNNNECYFHFYTYDTQGLRTEIMMRATKTSATFDSTTN